MCRKSGLEQLRRCGFSTRAIEGGGAPVWIRKDVVLRTCPTSFITPSSQAFVEEFFVRRRFGAIDMRELTAKQVEAFALLEKLFTCEMRDGQQHRRTVT